MNEDDIRYLFESTDRYPVSHETIAKYITAPKKISIKKMIENNELIAVKDYVVNVNDEYSLTLNAFKYCIFTYKCKFVKLFLSVEETILNERISVYTKKIEDFDAKAKDFASKLEEAEAKIEALMASKITTSVSTEFSNKANSDANSEAEVTLLLEANAFTEINKKANTSIELLNKVLTQLELLPEILRHIDNMPDFNIISTNIDNLLNQDIVKYSKKINSINIL